MTRPPAPALTAVLDELDELRAKATPGPWHIAGSGGIDAGEYDTVIAGGDVDCMSHCYGGTSTLDGDNLPADAALIVAAVNRLPELTAALRAVLAVLDDAEARNERSSFRFHDGSKRRPDVQVDAIRAAITTALEASR